MNRKKIGYIVTGVVVLTVAIVMLFVLSKGKEKQPTSSDKDNNKEYNIVEDDRENESDGEDNLVVEEDDNAQDNNIVQFDELMKAETENKSQEESEEAESSINGDSNADGDCDGDENKSDNVSDEKKEENTSTDQLAPAIDTNNEYGPIS